MAGLEGVKHCYDNEKKKYFLSWEEGSNPDQDYITRVCNGKRCWKAEQEKTQYIIFENDPHFDTYTSDFIPLPVMLRRREDISFIKEKVFFVEGKKISCVYFHEFLRLHKFLQENFIAANLKEACFNLENEAVDKISSFITQNKQSERVKRVRSNSSWSEILDVSFYCEGAGDEKKYYAQCPQKSKKSLGVKFKTVRSANASGELRMYTVEIADLPVILDLMSLGLIDGIKENQQKLMANLKNQRKEKAAALEQGNKLDIDLVGNLLIKASWHDTRLVKKIESKQK